MTKMICHAVWIICLGVSCFGYYLAYSKLKSPKSDSKKESAILYLCMFAIIPYPTSSILVADELDRVEKDKIRRL